MRTKKSFLNLLTDIIPQLVLALLSFVRVKLLLMNLGTEVVGVYQLFGQILPYLSLAEMGLTSAVQYSLYKPISEKNCKKISEILVGTKSVFNKILIIMIIIGILIAPNVKFFIANTTLTNTFIMCAFILLMLSNVIGYLSTPYVVMFDSSQEKYKYNFIVQITIIIKQIFEIVAVVLFKNLFVLLIIELLFSLLRIVVIKYLFKRNYNFVDFSEKKDISFIKKTKELIPHKIAGLIANNIDIVITSKVLGLASVVSYTSYFYIINIISNIIVKFSSATLAGIGNLVIESKERAYKVFLEYNSMLFFIATILCIPLAVVISPFVGLWYGNEFVVDNITVYLFVFVMFYGIVRIVLYTFAVAVGIFKETIICAYSEVVINLSVSLLLAKSMGIKGLLIGTAASLIISEFMVKPSILNKRVFNDKISIYYFKCLKLFTFAVLNFFVCKFIISFFKMKNLFMWFAYSTIIFIISSIITIAVYKLFNEFAFAKRIKLLKKKE